MSPEVRRELDYVIIRPHSPDDQNAIEQLHLGNWPKSNSKKDSAPEDLIPEPGETVFIAEDSIGEMVGCIYYFPRLVDVDLHGLVVKKACRRQGIAAELIRVAEEQAQRDGFVRITIEAASKKLVNYYQSLGFSLISNSRKRLAKDIGTKQFAV